MAAPTVTPIPVEIRGRALRSYRTRTLAEIDNNLRGLHDWLWKQLEDKPAFALEATANYLADLDALLDARLLRMRPAP